MIKGWTAAFLVLLPLAVLPARASGAEADPSARAKLISVDYVNAEVTDVIRALASQSGVNVAISTGVKGVVSVHLREKTVDEALMVVVNLAGLGGRRVNETYVVAPRAEMRAALERLGASRTVPVRYLVAKEAAEQLQGSFPDLTARAQGKAVLLVGAPEDLDSAERLLKATDIETPDVVRATERVELAHKPAKEAAAALAKMVPGVTAEPAGNAVVVAGTQAQVSEARRSLAMLDAPAEPDYVTRLYKVKFAHAAQLIQLVQTSCPGVQCFPGPESYSPRRPMLNLISGTLAGITSDKGTSNTNTSTADARDNTTPTGSQDKAYQGHALTLVLKGPPSAVEDAIRTLELADTPPVLMNITAKVVEASPEELQKFGVEWEWNKFQFYERPYNSGPSPVGPLGFGSYGRVPFDPVATLSAMVSRRVARVLASPQISVLNDQEASIFIGDTIRVRVLASSSATAGAQFTVLEIPVGIVLLCRARANDDGKITLKVHPVVSTLTGFVDGLPQTSSREAETTVRVMDGDTIVIAGLIREEDSKKFSKIPLLADLPLVGQLFRYEERQHKKSEIMIFVTIKQVKE